MTYPRIPYKAEGAPYETKNIPFATQEFDIPLIDFPITPKENYKLSWKRKTPMWSPMSITDIDSTLIRRTHSAGSPYGGKERFEYMDEWGCEWVYVPEAGGSMLKPGTKFLDDVTKWEKEVKFPDWKDSDWKESADNFNKTRRNPAKAFSLNFAEGCTQMLVALLGGYGEGMLAMAEEPEACTDFFEAYTDSMIVRYDLLREYYPDVDVIGYNDDWGNEKSTFFSAKYFEDMVYAPTKRLIDHIKASGDVAFELHSCGRVESFVPYMIDLGVDILQIQRRANDMPALKEKYGDKIGFCCHIEGLEQDAKTPKEEWLKKLRNTIDIYGRLGGLYIVFGAPPDPETMWDMCYEGYCYSREMYDKERGS